MFYNVRQIDILEGENMEGTITIRIPEELKNRLNTVTKKEKISVSYVVREALQQYLALKKFRQLRKKVLPFAEMQGLLTDDDIFKALQK
jgi:predicted transcriptional regulator